MSVLEKIFLILSSGCKIRVDSDRYKVGSFVICPHCDAEQRVESVERK